MLHPSYTDLMKVVNKDVEEGETKIVNSRYSIVMATAKRAREIIDGNMPLVPVKNGEKPLSVAIDELNQAKIKVVAQEEPKELEAKDMQEEPDILKEAVE
ncbi:MAG: DNA-directed RNA polymerase subunit omega [Dorea sp.]|jgi:DNA-directed RNA polymerase subunit omega|nr:DNA-directed RNA polymerase subunit omega [Dorea sp.]GFI43925.1 DNA-directed RNA polymerase subunit omega [Lachnospiraceae bacterium]